jgi:hypothetical protein
MLRRKLPANTGAEELKPLQEEPGALHFDAESQTYSVDKRVVGRVIVTNYNYASLPVADLTALYTEANSLPASDILIDIRGAYQGGEFPIHGALRLRSFLNVLSFLGRGIKDEPEFDVAPDPRTPPLHENPVHALEIAVGKGTPKGATLSVELGGNTFSVRSQQGYQWNKKAFSMLCQLFQMSVAPTVPPPPLITIAK